MLGRNSRYAQTLRYASTGEAVPFKGTRPREIRTLPGVIEHKLQPGDRLDLLALHYYNDPQRWYLILDANPDLMYGGDLTSGDDSIILIPQPPGERERR